MEKVLKVIYFSYYGTWKKYCKWTENYDRINSWVNDYFRFKSQINISKILHKLSLKFHYGLS